MKLNSVVLVWFFLFSTFLILFSLWLLAPHTETTGAKIVNANNAELGSEKPPVERPVAVSTVGPPAASSATSADDPFFVFNNGSLVDFFQGDQFFGSQDKVGVDSTVMNAYSLQTDDFLYIGSLNADREQFLATQGTILNNPNRKWHVNIIETGVVGGDVRVQVIGTVGMDVAHNGGIRMGIEGEVDEIWKLDLVGTQPTLLERTIKYHNGVATHAESPPLVLPPSGPGVLITN
jgi:hypothetical protein